LTTVGSTSSESVRDIYIGTLDAFPASAFPPADYIALGHLHRAQQVAGKAHIRYSGSPLPLSFDEAASDKEVVLVEFAKKGPTAQITPLTVPRSQELVLLKGTLEQIDTKLTRLLEEGALPDETPPIQLSFSFMEAMQQERKDNSPHKPSQPLIWLEVEVAGDDYLSDLQGRVETIVEGKPVELLRVRRKRKERSSQLERIEKEMLTELSVEDVFSRRLADETLEPDDQQQLQQAFSEILNQLAEQTSPDEATV
ncbi:MAG: exonuclease SbcCD subunit D C-terminal domain-containing protein, partial [Marinobacterium sp.]|nr:exonuclease SbcCD subunit D C-terminal domain-containing protein [Marinobacterium sp.]